MTENALANERENLAKNRQMERQRLNTNFEV